MRIARFIPIAILGCLLSLPTLAQPVPLGSESPQTTSPSNETPVLVSAVNKAPVLSDTALRDREIDRCTANRINYVRSASRKLYRALISKGYEMRPIKMSAELMATAGEPHVVEDGSVVGFTGRSNKHAFVAANTSRGHVIASVRWAGCSPASTQIEYPKVVQQDVALEPFKYWGFRVLWSLPKRLKRGDVSKSLAKLMKK